MCCSVATRTLEALHDAEEGEDFILPVAVAVDEPLAADDLGDGFEFEIAPHGRPASRFCFSRAAAYCCAAVKRFVWKAGTPMRVCGKRFLKVSPQLDCFTFSPSANLMPRGRAREFQVLRARRRRAV